MTQPLPPGHGTPAALPDGALPAELPDAALPAEQPDAALPAELPDAALPAELRAVIEAVHGVTAMYPARPLWQTIAGAARSAVTGEAPPAVDVIDSGAGATPSTVRTRIGVSGAYPAPEVARAVAAAVRRHFSPHPVNVHVGIVQIGIDQVSEAPPRKI